MRRRSWALAFPLLLAGCATRATLPVQQFPGLYAWGFETSSFQPCGSAERWWVAGAPPELQQLYRQAAERDYQPVYAVLRGEVGPEGSHGHMGAYRRELTVHEVVEVRPAREGDCG